MKISAKWVMADRKSEGENITDGRSGGLHVSGQHLVILQFCIALTVQFDITLGP